MSSPLASATQLTVDCLILPLCLCFTLFYQLIPLLSSIDARAPQGALLHALVFSHHKHFLVTLNHYNKV